MVSVAKILQPIARVASVYCRIDYKLDLSKCCAILVNYYLMLGVKESP